MARKKQEKNMIQERGLMTCEQAAVRLGVGLGFFNRDISPNYGARIGSRKYFSEQDLDNYLDKTLPQTAKVRSA